MPEQALRRHDDKRLAVVPVNLAPQGVEILRGSGEVADLHVVVRTQLQEPLEPRAGVLGTLAFVAVRQEEDK